MSQVGALKGAQAMQMKMTLEEFRVLPKEEREKMLGKATHAAIEKIHAAGMPSVHGDEKGTYNLYPDGRKEYLPDN